MEIKTYMSSIYRIMNSKCRGGHSFIMCKSVTNPWNEAFLWICTSRSVTNPWNEAFLWICTSSWWDYYQFQMVQWEDSSDCGGLRSLRSLRTLPLSSASSLRDNLLPTGPSRYPCPRVDTPPQSLLSSLMKYGYLQILIRWYLLAMSFRFVRHGYTRGPQTWLSSKFLAHGYEKTLET